MTRSSPRSAAAPRDAARDKGGGNVMALFVIASCQLMVVLDITIVNIALPHIQSALDFSTTSLSWVVNAYTLTFGGLLLLGGRSGDILGRRRVFIFGVLLFVLASLLGGFAQNEAQLLAARALQGVGGAIASPTALSLISTTFREGPELRGHELAQERLLVREVAIDGPDAHAGLAGDVVHLRVDAAVGEHGARRGDDPLAVAAGVGAERFRGVRVGCRHGVTSA